MRKPCLLAGHQPPPVAPGKVLALPITAGALQAPPTHSQVLLPSRGTGLSPTICPEPALHRAGEPQGWATAGLRATRTKPWITASHCMPIQCHLTSRTSQELSQPHPLCHPGYRNSRIFLFVINWLMLRNHQFKTHFRQSYWNVLCTDAVVDLNYRSPQKVLKMPLINLWGYRKFGANYCYLHPLPPPKRFSEK